MITYSRGMLACFRKIWGRTESAKDIFHADLTALLEQNMRQIYYKLFRYSLVKRTIRPLNLLFVINKVVVPD